MKVVDFLDRFLLKSSTRKKIKKDDIVGTTRLNSCKIENALVHLGRVGYGGFTDKYKVHPTDKYTRATTILIIASPGI